MGRVRTMAAPGGMRRGRRSAPTPAAIASTFRIGRNAMLMRDGAEAGETLIIGIRCLNLLAIRDRAWFGGDRERCKNGKHQSESDGGAAEARSPFDPACRTGILNCWKR
jgi:hypothetical protein